MFDSDAPIKSKNDDLLGRSNFAIDVANAIVQWELQDNLIIGLYGAWGSGKSSIINMMKEHLESLPVNEKAKVIEFNPWIFSEQEKLFDNFFKQLTLELKINDGSQYKKLAEKLEQYASAITMVQEVNKQINWSYIIQTIGLGVFVTGIVNKTYYMWLFGIIAAIGGVPTILSAIINFLNVNAKISKTTLNSLKTSIEEELKKLKESKKNHNKLLIIIDDIDRLNSTEIKQLFKLVRATANFPNIIYLLAFDKQIVENAFNHDASNEYYGYNYVNCYARW